jgi:hypothetical protein
MHLSYFYLQTICFPWVILLDYSKYNWSRQKWHNADTLSFIFIWQWADMHHQTWADMYRPWADMYRPWADMYQPWADIYHPIFVIYYILQIHLKGLRHTLCIYLKGFGHIRYARYSFKGSYKMLNSAHLQGYLDITHMYRYTSKGFLN